jgi:hypothetical protein
MDDFLLDCPITQFWELTQHYQYAKYHTTRRSYKNFIL